MATSSQQYDSPYSQKMTVSEYLAWEPLQECPYEYVNSEVLAILRMTYTLLSRQV